MNIDRLKEIAHYQQETGCRVEYPATTILALIDQLEAESRRKDFLRRFFTDPSRWTDVEIDASMAAREQKGFD